MSRSLGSWAAPRTEVTAAPLRDVVARLRREDGDAIAFGGVRFGRALVEGDVLDELQLYVNPTAIGRGEPLFAERAAWTLSRSTGYPCGIVVSSYARAPL